MFISKLIVFFNFFFFTNCFNQTNQTGLNQLNSDPNDELTLIITSSKNNFSTIPSINSEENDRNEFNVLNITTTITTQMPTIYSSTKESTTNSSIERLTDLKTTNFSADLMSTNSSTEVITNNSSEEILTIKSLAELVTTNSSAEVLATNSSPSVFTTHSSTKAQMTNSSIEVLTTISSNEIFVTYSSTERLSTNITLKNELSTVETTSIMKTTTEPNITDIQNTSNISTANTTTTPLIILDVIPVNTSLINQTKTLEEIFEEEERKHPNSTDSLLNGNLTDSNGQLNGSASTEIIPAGPGIPIFREPPEIMINDPDDGPIDPFIHPSNNTDDWDGYPSTETSDQQYVLMNRPEIEYEKGSLEEKYKHLLIDADDNIPLPSDSGINNKIQRNNSQKIEKPSNTSSTTISPDVLPYIPPQFPSYPSYPYYGYYNPYVGGYLQYSQYYPQYYGYNSPYFPQTYQSGYQSNQYTGYDSYGNPFIYSNTENTENIESQTTTQKSLDNKLLPKSFEKFGAYITKITIDDKQNQTNKGLVTGDEDSLEVLGPIEWVATTQATTTSTLPNEIRFLINQQNMDQMTRYDSYLKKKPIHEKRKNSNAQRQRQLIRTNTAPPLYWNVGQTVGPLQTYIESSEPIQRRVVYRRRKLPQNRRRRIKIHRFVKINNKTDQNEGPSNKYSVGSEAVSSNRRKVQRVSVKQSKANQTQRHQTISRIRPKNADQSGGFQRKSGSTSEPDWKTTTKPNFLMVAKMKDLNHLKVDSLTGIKWWHQEQPSYCSEPIYLLSDCSNRQMAKRWSYNHDTKKCYLYEDYCYQFKANSFETSQECFRKCYRIKE